MNNITGPEDIYDELVENSDEDWLLGLVAFAVIQEQFIEWLKHFESTKDRKPGYEEVREWYSHQPEGVLLRARDTAEARLKDYSDQVVEVFYEDQFKEMEESILVQEIRDTKRFWPQFGVNLAGGFVSAILFAVVLSIFAFFVIYDTSPVDIGKNARDQLEEMDHAKK